jgi:hypothetical protein
MTRGIGGWVLCGFLALAGTAPAQGTILPRAQLWPRAGLGVPLEETPPQRDDIRPVVQIRPVPGDPEDVIAPLIQRDPPGPERLFRLESEADLFARIRIERRLLKLHMDVPPHVEREPLPYREPRVWPELVMEVEPNYLCYGRLRFEQRNAERYGWDLGILHPPISAAIFYKDVLTLPLSWAVDPLRCYDCNPGLCLPGDSTPLMWYRLRAR